MTSNKTASDWEREIVQVTVTIGQRFPELTKYLDEMPKQMEATGAKAISNEIYKDYHDSLVLILEDYAKTHTGKKLTKRAESILLPGYPHYSPSEDIYNQAKELKDVNPENLSKTKAPNEKPGTRNEKGFREAMSGSDLDIPGAELDDAQEKLGSEDEENNHYSLGGDAHNDLEENKG